jgi:hypothetical protein
MGSMTSRPEIRPQPQVIYMPAPQLPIYNPPPAAPTATGGNDEEAHARAGSLLLRDRGRFGTVLTGFRGLLAPLETGPRKTLLGE